MEHLAGKVAVVTGAGSGIGKALAERFVAEGMRVVLADIDEVRLRSVEAQLSENGGNVLPVVCDTALEESVQALAQKALDHYGAAHVLCNNAGVVGTGDPWAGPISVWDWVIGINLYGVIHGVRAFLPIMQEQGEGHIVNTASMAGLLAMPGAAAYNVTKHGVVALSEGLFTELKSTGSPVSVSVLCPGFVKTELMKQMSWAARLGEQPAASSNPVAQFMDQMLVEGVESGISPVDVADQVVDAITSDRFWILTHPDFGPGVTERYRKAVAQENPV
ncbi:MAG: putative oxidoreductase [Ilumatobacteraceae bacterium]|nr:putative oxidoreductase [Ilumatobacteraceae bacterium]MCU1391447.1 putative oxidoreductase [Ilumatobacteraceae bacterium]